MPDPAGRSAPSPSEAMGPCALCSGNIVPHFVSYVYEAVECLRLAGK